MGIYEIAKKKVCFESYGEILTSRAKKYKINDSEIEKKDCDIIIELDDEEFIEYKEKYKHYGYSALEYAWVGTKFYRGLLELDGMYLHSSVVEVDEKAYIFSADSGVGKSTHTSLWREYFGDRASIINDDKPAILNENGEIKAYGTPFSGKNDISENKGVKVQALCFLERGEKNEIKKIGTDEAIRRLYSQLLYSDNEEYMIKLLNMIDIFLKNIPVYVLKCTISEEAVKTAYEEMNK